MSAITMIAKQALERAGIDGYAHHGAHLFRHSLATDLLRSGASFAEIARALNAEGVTTPGLEAQPRQPRAARRSGFVPVNVYGKGKSNVSANLEARVLSNEYFRGGFMNKIVSLSLDGKEIFAIPRDIASL